MDLHRLFLEEEKSTLDEVERLLNDIKSRIDKQEFLDFTIQKPERIVINILMKKLKTLYPTSEISETMIRDNHYFRVNNMTHTPYTVDECVIGIDLKDNDLKQFEIKKRKREIEFLDPDVKVDLQKNQSGFHFEPKSTLSAFGFGKNIGFGSFNDSLLRDNLNSGFNIGTISSDSNPRKKPILLNRKNKK
jgi:hypothetical protein